MRNTVQLDSLPQILTRAISMTQDIVLRQQDVELVDGESNLITLDVCYEVRGSELQSTIRKIKDIHGSAARFLPMSGKSAGGGVFQIQAAGDDIIIGLNIAATVSPKIRHASDVDIKKVALDEIVINESDYSIYAGAAITLQQLNQALADESGLQYMVLGADLTSYTYARVGSTFMTGGMGPQRRYFSDSVVEIALHDGHEVISISGDKLLNYAGTYGWTGLVSAVKCTFHQLPTQEFAFSIPVKNTPEQIARLLNHFSRFVYLENAGSGKLQPKNGVASLILGLEHITVGSMQPLLDSNLVNTAYKIAKEIVANCNSANSEGMIFVYGLSELPIDEVICELVDDVESENLTIANIDLEYTYYFSDLNVMRDFREAVSYAARNQEPKGSYSYKGHTDANIWINPNVLEPTVKVIWQVYLNYVDAVEDYFKSKSLIKGEILIYGHLNPVGIDPHNRITLASENEASFHDAIKSLDELKKKLVLKLADICENSGSIFTGGEKGAGSDHELLSAFDRFAATPRALSEKFERQKLAISNASPSFNWRAFAPYK